MLENKIIWPSFPFLHFSLTMRRQHHSLPGTSWPTLWCPLLSVEFWVVFADLHKAAKTDESEPSKQLSLSHQNYSLNSLLMLQDSLQSANNSYSWIHELEWWHLRSWTHILFKEKVCFQNMPYLYSTSYLLCFCWNCCLIKETQHDKLYGFLKQA